MWDTGGIRWERDLGRETGVCRVGEVVKGSLRVVGHIG